MSAFPRLSGWLTKRADDDGLIEAARRGDRPAFDALVRRYDRSVRGFIAVRIGRDAIEDVAQETWLAAWKGMPSYARRSRFNVWLLGIAAHKCTDYLRRAGGASAPVPLDETLIDTAAGSRDRFADVDLREAIRGALARLPESQRDVVTMYYYGELTLAEVAAALDRNLNTVKYQFYQAHCRITTMLQSEGSIDAQSSAQQPIGTKS